MTEAQGNFATALAEFGCGSDEESLIMGALLGPLWLAETPKLVLLTAAGLSSVSGVTADVSNLA